MTEKLEQYCSEQLIQYFHKNKIGRDFVCGDIHGCFNELELELKKIDFNESRDRLFCVGDLIDRGPYSKYALLYYQKDWFHAVRGNHENNFSKFFAMYGKDYSYYDIYNGTEWSQEMPEYFLKELKTVIDTLPYIIVIDDTLILHAQLPPVISLQKIENNPEKYLHKLIWSRNEKPQKINIPGISRVYCGHTIVEEPIEQNGIINIDTGAFLTFYGKKGKLTVQEI
ncbi:serine/threonine protein phosphatase [Betaproteobacteria bacterium]|nr:serine/threonine protein phosphatase [Betaproteobacteria bacterium]